MTTPKYIRVAGQLYRQREEEIPAFVKHDGWIYKLAQTGAENVAAIDALTKLSNLAKKMADSVKDQQISKLLQQAYGELGVLATKLAKGDFEAKSAALKNWEDLKKGLSQFAQQLEKAQLSKLSSALTKMLQDSDTALSELQKAEGLGAEFGTPGGVTPSGKPSVDWGEHAPKKDEPQPLHASTVPGFFTHKGEQYRPLLPITKEAVAWATSTDPNVIAERKTFPPLVVHLLASGVA